MAVYRLCPTTPHLAITICAIQATSVLPINGMGRDHRCDPRASESAYPASALSLLSDENLGPTGDTAHPGFVGCRANGGTAINDNGGSRCLDPPTHPNNLNLLGPPVAIDSHEQTWQRWINRATPQDKLLSVVETLFSSREAIDVVDSLRGSDAQAFIDVMDEVGRHFLYRPRSGPFTVFSFCLLGVG